MKIMFVVPSLRKGGAERVVVKLSNHLNSIGHDCIILLFQNEISYQTTARVISLESPSSTGLFSKVINVFKRVSGLRRVFRMENPDRIFSFTETCNIPSILSGEKLHISVRNFPGYKLTRAQKISIFFLYRFRNVKSIVSVSKKIGETLKNDYFLNNVKIIENPIVEMVSDTDTFIESDFSNGGYWLAVGRLDHQKGFDLLIKAYSESELAKTFPLVIIGSGKLKDSLIKLSKELCVDSQVFFLGEKEDVENWYENCFSFVLSSRFEGFPNVLVEALSFGVPCIATRCKSGPDEIINEGKNGLLSDLSKNGLRSSMEKLVLNPGLRREIASNAKSSVSKFEIDTVSKKWLGL
ncbi:glycosyltransferase [Vibrio lamellibrachiae]|uniref:glycosyltransferase n=1 Tax=Vibrio lamellibrachiae TaxID=2910253 RepID=UPI003D0B58A0